MANRRKSKSVLGQISNIVKEKVEMTEELVVEEPVVEISVEEEVVETPVEDVVVEELEVPEQPIEVVEEEMVVEAPKVRKVSDLNAQEYRYYMNTGIIPQ